VIFSHVLYQLSYLGIGAGRLRGSAILAGRRARVKSPRRGGPRALRHKAALRSSSVSQRCDARSLAADLRRGARRPAARACPLPRQEIRPPRSRGALPRVEGGGARIGPRRPLLGVRIPPQAHRELRDDGGPPPWDATLRRPRARLAPCEPLGLPGRPLELPHRPRELPSDPHRAPSDAATQGLAQRRIPSAPEGDCLGARGDGMESRGDGQAIRGARQAIRGACMAIRGDGLATRERRRAARGDPMAIGEGP
jgi:hypothetical protein